MSETCPKCGGPLMKGELCVYCPKCLKVVRWLEGWREREKTMYVAKYARGS